MSGDAPGDESGYVQSEDADGQRLMREQIDQIRADAADAIKPQKAPADPLPLSRIRSPHPNSP